MELYESSEERLVGGVIFEDERHYALSMRTVSCITKRKNYDYTKFCEEIGFIRRARWQERAGLVQPNGVGLSPLLLLREIEVENPEFTLYLIDRDAYLDLAKVWDVYGIPSLVVLEKDTKSVGLSIGIGNQSAD